MFSLSSSCPLSVTQRYAREGPGTILLSVCDKAPDLSDISLNGKHCKLLAVDSVDYFTVESSKLHYFLNNTFWSRKSYSPNRVSDRRFVLA